MVSFWRIRVEATLKDAILQVAHLVAAYSESSSSSYGQMVSVLQELGREVRPAYAGNRASTERLKRGMAHARSLVREAMMECERAAAAAENQ